MKCFHLNILFNFLDVLKRIERGELDQHEASFEVGTLLKRLYVDSALKKADKLEKEHEQPLSDNKVEVVNISWSQFKRNNIQ